MCLESVWQRCLQRLANSSINKLRFRCAFTNCQNSFVCRVNQKFLNEKTFHFRSSFRWSLLLVGLPLAGHLSGRAHATVRFRMFGLRLLDFDCSTSAVWLRLLLFGFYGSTGVCTMKYETCRPDSGISLESEIEIRSRSPSQWGAGSIVLAANEERG